jgi:hypothetical protein
VAGCAGTPPGSAGTSLQVRTNVGNVVISVLGLFFVPSFLKIPIVKDNYQPFSRIGLAGMGRQLKIGAPVPKR